MYFYNMFPNIKMQYIFKTDLIASALLQMVTTGRVTVSKERALMVQKDVATAVVHPSIQQGKIIEKVCKVIETQCHI